jgi:hypothetical protein
MTFNSQSLPGWLFFPVNERRPASPVLKMTGKAPPSEAASRWLLC